jgi:signal peptidase II
MSVLLLGGGLVATLLLLTAGLKANSRPLQAGWGLMVGGGMGNALDRLWFGQVTDFIDLRVGDFGWPVFNLADVFIATGILILSFVYLRGGYGQADHI